MVQSNIRNGGVKIFLTVLKYVVLSLVAVIFLYPFVWMISTSFKHEGDFLSEGLALITSNPTVENFVRVWTKASFGRYFINTVVVTVIVTVMVLIITSLCGYVLGRYHFAGKKAVYALFVSSICIPATTTVIPIYRIISSMSLNGTLTGLILATVGGGHVVFILLFQGEFQSIPNELEEAALVDGCSFAKMYWQVMLPMAKPVISTTVIMQAIWTWNDFLLPLVLTLSNSKSRTLAVGLYVFQGENTIDWTGICAGASISIIPIIVIFLFMQRYFVEGVAGAVKG